MRTIKFRVFGKENNIMYSWDELLGMDSFKEHMMFATAEDRYYSPLMQNTGLKDKNGQEIYELDILKWDEEVWGTSKQELVEWNYELLSFRKIDWLNHCEVIGNIFENPELIN
jgi:uncharacterized phage protein (TIGR01671 family)